MEKNNIQAEILLKETHFIGQQIADANRTVNQVMGVSLTAIALLLLYGAKSDMYEVFIIAPLFFLSIAGLSINNIYQINLLGGYRYTLEEELNKELGCVLLRWEKYVAPIYKKSLLVKYLWLVLFLILTIVTLYSWWMVDSYYGVNVGVIHLSVYSLMVLFTMAEYFVMNNASNVVRESLRNIEKP